MGPPVERAVVNLDLPFEDEDDDAQTAPLPVPWFKRDGSGAVKRQQHGHAGYEYHDDPNLMGNVDEFEPNWRNS